MRVLLIEDDAMLGAGLSLALRDAGMSVDWARDGAEGEHAFETSEYALVLLDLNLPLKSGLQLLHDARRRKFNAPVLILTARDATEDRVRGLDLGADDYLVKPFAVTELLARIRAVLRRHRGHAKSSIGNGRVSIDLASHEATCGGISMLLPAREFALLNVLLEQPGRILSRQQIEDRIYGWGEEVESNAVDVLIYSIRRKFGKDVILNVRGAGWMVARS